MESRTNNSAVERIDDGADRPFCVFYVDPATPKAILADTIMASSNDEARRRAGKKFKTCMILYVRGVGAEGDGTVAVDPDPTCNRHLAPLEAFPGARFIDGEFRAAGESRDNDEIELAALGD